MRAVKEFIGTRIAAFINAPNKNYEPLVCGLDRVDFKPADIILVSSMMQSCEDKMLMAMY